MFHRLAERAGSDILHLVGDDHGGIAAGVAHKHAAQDDEAVGVVFEIGSAVQSAFARRNDVRTFRKRDLCKRSARKCGCRHHVHPFGDGDFAAVRLQRGLDRTVEHIAHYDMARRIRKEGSAFERGRGDVGDVAAFGDFHALDGQAVEGVFAYAFDCGGKFDARGFVVAERVGRDVLIACRREVEDIARAVLAHISHQHLARDKVIALGGGVHPRRPVERVLAHGSECRKILDAHQFGERCAAEEGARADGGESVLGVGEVHLAHAGHGIERVRRDLGDFLAVILGGDVEHLRTSVFHGNGVGVVRLFDELICRGVVVRAGFAPFKDEVPADVDRCLVLGDDFQPILVVRRVQEKPRAVVDAFTLGDEFGYILDGKGDGDRIFGESHGHAIGAKRGVECDAAQREGTHTPGVLCIGDIRNGFGESVKLRARRQTFYPVKARHKRALGKIEADGSGFQPPYAVQSEGVSDVGLGGKPLGEAPHRGGVVPDRGPAEQGVFAARIVLRRGTGNCAVGRDIRGGGIVLCLRPAVGGSVEVELDGDCRGGILRRKAQPFRHGESAARRKHFAVAVNVTVECLPFGCEKLVRGNKFLISELGADARVERPHARSVRALYVAARKGCARRADIHRHGDAFGYARLQVDGELARERRAFVVIAHRDLPAVCLVQVRPVLRCHHVLGESDLLPSHGTLRPRLHGDVSQNVARKVELAHDGFIKRRRAFQHLEFQPVRLGLRHGNVAAARALTAAAL